MMKCNGEGRRASSGWSNGIRKEKKRKDSAGSDDTASIINGLMGY
jgi:hypothetical protein